MQHSVLFLIKKQTRTFLVTEVTDNFLMIVNLYCWMTCCCFSWASEFSQQEASQGCSLTLRHGRCSRWTYTRFALSPLEQLCKVPVTQQNSGGWMGNVYLSSPSQSSFWECLFSGCDLTLLWLSHIFLLMIPQCRWGKKCNCSTICCGQCIENATLLGEERWLFVAFAFALLMLFCDHDHSSGFTLAQYLSSHDTQN